MGFGQVSQSFLTILTNKKKYTVDDYKNQNIYNRSPSKIPKTSSTFRTMSCFVGIAQVEFNKIQEFGETLAEALGETGTKEQSVQDKLCNIIRLSKGGKLPNYLNY